MDEMVYTRRPNTVNKLAMIFLQCIMTPLFVSLDMFALFISYFLCLIRNNDYCIGYQIDAMMYLMPIRLYKRHDLS